MKISELIQNLQEKLAKHGDLTCIAFQHPEEEESKMEVSSLYVDEEDKELTIS